VTHASIRVRGQRDWEVPVPTISDPVLAMTLDTEGNITAKVDYNITFTTAEKSSNVRFIERATLYDRKGLLDDWGWQAGPDSDDAVDSLVHLFQNIGGAGLASMDHFVLDFGGNEDLDPSGPDAEKPRSFTKVLGMVARARLLEVGREHPYVLVFIVPKQIGADFKLSVPLEIDVGDPA